LTIVIIYDSVLFGTPFYSNETDGLTTRRRTSMNINSTALFGCVVLALVVGAVVGQLDFTVDKDIGRAVTTSVDSAFEGTRNDLGDVPAPVGSRLCPPGRVQRGTKCVLAFRSSSERPFREKPQPKVQVSSPNPFANEVVSTKPTAFQTAVRGPQPAPLPGHERPERPDPVSVPSGTANIVPDSPVLDGRECPEEMVPVVWGPAIQKWVAAKELSTSQPSFCGYPDVFADAEPERPDPLMPEGSLPDFQP
jgi:hypothetical protein